MGDSSINSCSDSCMVSTELSQFGRRSAPVQFYCRKLLLIHDSTPVRKLFDSFQEPFEPFFIDRRIFH